MILRGVDLSNTRQALPSPQQQPSRETAVHNGKLVHMFNASPELEPVVEPEGTDDTTESLPELTFESVAAWLAVQESETRKSCASLLANEVTKIYEQAKADGFASGKQAAEAELNTRIAAEVASLRAVRDAAEDAFAQQSAQLEELCTEVIGEAFAKIAGRILGSEAAAVGAVRQVLKQVNEGREVRIRVSLHDIDVVRRHEAELSDALAGYSLTIAADARVELGGALVETKLGCLDGRLEVQLRELYETLRLAKSTMSKPDSARESTRQGELS